MGDESANPQLQPRNIVVTGASSGIGSVVAKALAAHGDRVAIGARRGDQHWGGHIGRCCGWTLLREVEGRESAARRQGLVFSYGN